MYVCMYDDGHYVRGCGAVWCWYGAQSLTLFCIHTHTQTVNIAQKHIYPFAHQQTFFECFGMRVVVLIVVVGTGTANATHCVGFDVV